MVLGGQHTPVKFVALPFSYQGSGLSPAVAVEDLIVQALSSTGLFSMPYRYDVPANTNNMMAWQFNGIRYVLQGQLIEADKMLTLRLSIDDTLGLQPTISRVILNPEQLTLSSQMFADQVYRSLFYATFTNDTEKQYLANENPVLTRYLNQLVMTFKAAWVNDQGKGSCTVDIQQMPGGVPFKSELNEDCFLDRALPNEIQQALESIEVLPYENYQTVFERNLKIEFISLN
ncbi:hypothetical protein C8D91_0315 [Marinicella litoralis]|uniref:Uncharacterized protein n=2 Tax=Marinicella litoralis TaxID=644220 RepID=A0A4R6XYQ8_9GAMM|nr:hypothetical protein C8D91_0315 [Marinicella litoralis]